MNFYAKRAKYPTFKSLKKSRASAEYTRSAFSYRDGRLTLAKITRLVRENQTVVIEDLMIRNMVANHRLARDQ